MSRHLIKFKPEELPRDRRCTKPGCDGEYYLIYNCASCYKCGTAPYSRAPLPGKNTTKRDNEAAKRLVTHIDFMNSINWLTEPEIIEPDRVFDADGNLLRKRCPRCNIMKRSEYYYKTKSRVDGHQTHCKMCFGRLPKSRPKNTRYL